MFERSEFGPRAPPTEKRREPDWRSQSGSRPAKTVLVTFAKTKVTRATARKLLQLLFLRNEQALRRQEQELSPAARASSF
ncbi:hypothetical protein [Luteimonas saliphila]|uniref:hypothetical protein n=1 Tax=Luteimonas saliphila TaxID=2804919 RepID=UPI00192D5D62|nr:hypothetical protein [Luteimonas saliphila]